MRAHGLRGDLRLHLHLPDTLVLDPGRLRIGTSEHEILSARWASARTVDLSLRGVSSRQSADALIGSTVSVLSEWFKGRPRPLCGLAGLVVIDVETNTEVGRVEAIDHTGAHAILSIRQGEDEILVPFVDAFIEAVDEDTIRVRPIPGLLEPR